MNVLKSASPQLILSASPQLGLSASPQLGLSASPQLILSASSERRPINLHQFCIVSVGWTVKMDLAVFDVDRSIAVAVKCSSVQ